MAPARNATEFPHHLSYQVHGGKPQARRIEMVFLIPIVAIVSTFTFISLVTWFATQQKEREAFYKSETMRRISESSGDGAKAAIELMREEERLKRIKTREGLKIGGVINLAVGIGVLIFLRALVPVEPVYLCGLIPGMIGVAMIVYVYFMAPPVE
jgi:hypothetical protein